VDSASLTEEAKNSTSKVPGYFGRSEMDKTFAQMMAEEDGMIVEGASTSSSNSTSRTKTPQQKTDTQGYIDPGARSTLWSARIINK
jgi:hypothetical protein